MDLPVTYADVDAARDRLKGVAHRTPVMTSRTADAATGATLYFKCENLQRIGAFKFRGAYNALAQFTPGQRKRGVIAFSSGNHAQAVALAAKLIGMPAVIVMPHDAPKLKVEATRGYGAEVIGYDRFKEDREAISRKLSQERGLTLIPPFDHPHVIAGQGTAVAELIEDVGALDLLLVCVGGGGLISGSALAAKHLSPDCRVIGVEPEAGNDVQQSFREGRIVRIDVPKTLADGAQTQAPGQITFAVIRALVSDVVTVSDPALVRAMRFFAERMKIVVEPTGALGAAAVFERVVPVAGKRVGIVISGGNVDPAFYGQLLAGTAG